MSALHTLNGKPIADPEILRAALAEAVALLDEERAGTKSGWSHEDSAKLERLRALVKL